MPTPTVSPALPPGHQLVEHITHGDHLHQLRVRRQRVAGHEVVDVRQDRQHPLLHRLVARLAAVRVDPHHAVRDPVQPPHLLGQERGVAPLPAVAEDDDHGAARHAAPAPPVEEEPQRLAEAGAAGPVGHGARRRRPARARRRGSASARVRWVRRVPTVKVSTTPPASRAPWVKRCASRSSESAYPLIEPDTSISSTTRRGLVPRRRQAISPGSPIRRRLARSVREASTSPRCQDWCRAVRRRGGRGRSRANIADSRCFSAAVRRRDVAVAQHLGVAGHRPDHVLVLGGLALAAAVGLGEVGVRRGSRAGPAWRGAARRRR